MTLVHEIGPLDSMNNLGLRLTKNTLCCVLRTVDVMQSLRLSMIRKTPSHEFRDLNDMNISGLWLT